MELNGLQNSLKSMGLQIKVYKIVAIAGVTIGLAGALTAAIALIVR